MNCVVHIYVLGNLCSQTYPSAYSTEDVNGLWTQHTTLQSTPYTIDFNVSEVNHTWTRDSGNCVDGWTLSGKRMFNSCRSDLCQTINANRLLPNVKKKPSFLWIDGYVVRSPVMEYYECLAIRNVNTANALSYQKNLTHNGVEKCSVFCQQEGILKNKDFILLQNEICYCLPANTYKQWNEHLDEIRKKSTEDCDIQCDDDKFDRCGGNTDLFSAYKLKTLPISAEIDGNCYFTPGSGTKLKSTKCKDTLKFKCEKVVESVADGKRTIKVKCYEYMLNWYDARKECNRTGRYIQLLNNKCENNEGFTADKLWHNTFVKERIIWNTSIVTDMERNKGYSCLAMKLTQDSKYILTAQSCDYKFKSLCQKDVSGQHIDGTSVSRTDQSTIFSMYVGIAVAVTILLILVIVLAVCIRRRKRHKTENGPAAHNVYYSTVTGDQIQENQSNTRDGANRDQSVENLLISAKKINTHKDNDQQETNKQGAMYDQAGLQDTNVYDVSSTYNKYTPKVQEDVCYYDHNQDVDTMYDATDTKGLIQRNEMSDIYDHTRDIDDAYDVSNAYRQKDKTINESVYSQSDF